MDGPVCRIMHPGHEGCVGFARVDDVADQLVAYMKEVRKTLPSVQFFDGCNFPNWGWKGGPSYWGKGPRKQFYGDLWNVLPVLVKKSRKAGVPLAGVTVDNPYDFAIGTATASVLPSSGEIDWMKRILDLDRYVKSKGMEFSIFFNCPTSGEGSDEHY